MIGFMPVVMSLPDIVLHIVDLVSRFREKLLSNYPCQFPLRMREIESLKHDDAADHQSTMLNHSTQASESRPEGLSTLFGHESIILRS